MDDVANNLLEDVDREGRELDLDDWIELLELVRDGIDSRLNAAREDSAAQRERRRK